MSELPRDTEAKTILDAGIRLGIGKVIPNPNPETDALIVVPNDSKVEYIKRADFPPRKKGIVNLDDLKSFIHYFNNTNDGVKAIYGCVDPLQFTGLLNEHNSSDLDMPPDWRDFGCKYVPKFSREWQTWTSRSKQPFDGNEAFAIWLEDNLADVINPDNGRLLEIAINFRVNSNAAFANQIRLQDGDTEFNFTNAVEGSSQSNGGKVKIPELITIAIPVFQGRSSQVYEIDAKFRFRLHSGSLKIHYELVRPHKVLEQAFNDMVDKIEEETKQTVLYGSPDAK